MSIVLEFDPVVFKWVLLSAPVVVGLIYLHFSDERKRRLDDQERMAK